MGPENASVCDATGPDLLPVDEAAARIEAAIEPLEESRRVALDAALGRILAEDVAAPRDVPGHTNSAVDGYALHGAQLPSSGERAFRVTGTAWAGQILPAAVLPVVSKRRRCGAVDAERLRRLLDCHCRGE